MTAVAQDAKDFADAAFTAASSAWDNPDWVEVTLHSYRVR